MTGWGAVHSGRPVRGVWTDELRMLAHKSFGTTGSLPGSQTVLTTVEGYHVLDRTDQHDCNFLCESSRSITLSCNNVSMGLCPVRALRIYVDRTAQWRGSDQLFVCFGGKSKGSAVTKQQMSHWLVEAISLAYEARGLTSPLGLHAHSTRAVAPSQAFLTGSLMEDVCATAGWSSPSTFIKFYSLDMRMAPDFRVLSTWEDAFQLSKVRQALWYSFPIAMTSTQHWSEPMNGTSRLRM